MVISLIQYSLISDCTCHGRFFLTLGVTYHWPAQELRAGPGSRILLHVFNKPISFGVARELTVHQEGALNVSIRAHQFLKLLGGEGVGQVGEAQQGVGGLQGDVDQTPADSAVVEGADGILSLVPVQQSHKSWRRGHYGDGDEGKRRTRNKNEHKEGDTQTQMDGQTRTNTDIHLKRTFKKQAESVLRRMETHSQRTCSKELT